MINVDSGGEESLSEELLLLGDLDELLEDLDDADEEDELEESSSDEGNSSSYQLGEFD